MSIAAVFNLFLLLSALFGFIFSVGLFSSKYGREKSIVYLNIVIILIAISHLQSWAIKNGLYLNNIRFSWHFLAMPFFYMFIIQYLNLKKKYFNILKIAVPIFIVLTFAQIIFINYYSNKLSPEKLNFICKKYFFIEEMFIMITSISIFLYTMYIVYKKEKSFSKILSYDNLKWLHNYFKLASLGYFLWIVTSLIKIKLNLNEYEYSYYLLRTYTLVLIYWLGYQAIIRIRILREREKIRKQLLIDVKGNYNIEPSNLRNNETKEANYHKRQKQQFREIDNFIISQKKFLLTKYTLNELSKDVDLSPSTLSSIINNIAEQSFTDYLNEMRINLAKSLLLNPQYKEYTITSIGLESGFNSKSTFYTVFKKHTGHTPVEFKNLSS